MIIQEVINQQLTKKNLLLSFNKLLNDKNFRDNQIINIKKSLFEIESPSNPYDICEKRIHEIISKAI